MNECKNCGADYGLHHADTNQCPMNGREAPIGRKQEWKSTTFQERTESPYENMAERIGLLITRIEALEKELQAEISKRNKREMIDLGDGVKIDPIIADVIFGEDQ